MRSRAFSRLARRRCLGPAAQGQPVDEHVDAMPAVRVEPRRLGEAHGVAVDPRPLQAEGPGRGELLAVAALPAARDGRRDDRDRALGLAQQALGHLLGASAP